MESRGKSQDRQRGISIHRATAAVPLEETDLMTAPEMSAAAIAGIGTVAASGLGAGSRVDVTLRQSEEEGGFSLVRLWFKPNYPLVRHSHDADCLYYVLSGAAIMGNQTLRTGDSFYVPAGAPYAYSAGPDGVEILEIRHGVAQFNMVILDQSETRWEAMANASTENRELWSTLVDSPTLVANGAD